ncbi:sodium:solute symporter [Streptomyces sp. NPDC004609]|uniref:sodium:solute symporter family protein n=1 Tax=Streptomyces sp. NPDC004609 TaxID=3364704 RepID=UPI0036C1D4A7
MLIGYGSVAVFLAVVIIVLERSRRVGGGFTEYAVAGRSFGPWYQTMSFMNTWMPGAVFVSFAGLAAETGVLGFYWVLYSLLIIVLMFFMATRVHDWGRAWNLQTQADLLGMRYGSRPVRVVSAVIGAVSAFPWIVMGMQSLGLVFSYLSFGRVSATAAILVSIAVLAARQIWTVRMGMRGIVISDMVQAIVAYVIGLFLILGLLVWLVSNGHGLGAVPDAHFLIPGPGSAVGPLYLMSLVVTGALGGWCWPDMFVRLFTARSAGTIKKSAVQAAPILFVFASALTLLGLLGASVPGVGAAPATVWFVVAGAGGTLVVALAGVVVLAATMGNVDANLQATGIQMTHDILPAAGREIGPGDDGEPKESRTAKLTVAVVTILAAVVAATSVKSTTGVADLAILSFQGVVQLAPTLFFGIFWRKGNAIGALGGMVSGIAVAAVLQLQYPTSVPWLGGMTSGMAALIVNTAVYAVAAVLLPHSAAERARVDALFTDLGRAEGPGETSVPKPVPTAP